MTRGMAMLMGKQPSTNRTISAAGPWQDCGGRRTNKTVKETHMLTPMLAEMTGNLHVAAAAAGAAIGVGMIGMKASEAVGRNPGAATKILVQPILSTAFAEGIVFFAIFLAR